MLAGAMWTHGLPRMLSEVAHYRQKATKAQRVASDSLCLFLIYAIALILNTCLLHAPLSG